MPRFDLPPELESLCKSDNYHRATHTYGKAFRDVWRAIRGKFENAPDYVAYPKTENDIIDLMKFCSNEKVALIPYGGGSSVVGGIEPRISNRYRGCISLDMKHFDQVLEIDKTSRCAKNTSRYLWSSIGNTIKKTWIHLKALSPKF